MVRKINWDDITESDILILKENEPISVKFLNNGMIDETEVLDKKTDKMKIINKYVFKVIDTTDNEEKEFSTLANRLMTKLKQFNPLIDKVLLINKFKTGPDVFDVDFEVSQIK